MNPTRKTVQITDTQLIHALHRLPQAKEMFSGLTRFVAVEMFDVGNGKKSIHLTGEFEAPESKTEAKPVPKAEAKPEPKAKETK